MLLEITIGEKETYASCAEMIPYERDTRQDYTHAYLGHHRQHCYQLSQPSSITLGPPLTSLFTAAVREHRVGSLVAFGSDTTIRVKTRSHHALNFLITGVGGVGG